jgi:hypothetical protein
VNTAVAFQIARLDKMIALARQLGFWDDVAHWEAEKKRLIEREKS